MDESLGDEVDVHEGAHFNSKEDNYLPKPPQNSNLLDSNQIAFPVQGDCAGGPFNLIANFLDTKDAIGNINSVDLAEQLHNGPHYMDDFGNIVEELTVQSYDRSNLPIVGASNSRERLQTREGQWAALGVGSSYNSAFERGDDQGIPSDWENKASSSCRNEVIEQRTDAENRGVSSNMFPDSGIRTKVLSKSGFAEFFVKSTLKGKGITFRGPPNRATKIAPKDDNIGKTVPASLTSVAFNSSPALGDKIAMPSPGIHGLKPTGSSGEGVNLRHWLNSRKCKLSKVKSLHIFRKIVDLVDCSHSQGVILRDLRPSCFRLLLSNQVTYVGSTVKRDTPESSADEHRSYLQDNLVRRRPEDAVMLSFGGSSAKKQKLSENSTFTRQWPQFTRKFAINCETANDGDVNLAGAQGPANTFSAIKDYPNTEYGIPAKSTHGLPGKAQQQLTPVCVGLEEKWYASPEELNEGVCSMSSNIYSLGVLLFELLGYFDAGRGYDMVMSDLRHRIFPAQFLSECPKEAGFCLRLLHPAPSSTPKI